MQKFLGVICLEKFFAGISIVLTLVFGFLHLINGIPKKPSFHKCTFDF